MLGNDSVENWWIFSWRKGGEQPMNLHGGCSNGTIKHELLHALGFIHEHERMDRDKYVDIKWENIEDDKEYNFDKVPLGKVDTHGQEYDYASIMHYPKYAFSENNKITIETKDREAQDTIGQRRDLSESDVFELRRAYDCPVVSEQNCACKKTWSVDGVELVRPTSASVKIAIAEVEHSKNAGRLTVYGRMAPSAAWAPHATGVITRRRTGMGRPSQPVAQSRSGITELDASLVQAVMHAEKRQPTGMGRPSQPVAQSQNGITDGDACSALAARHAGTRQLTGTGRLLQPVVRSPSGVTAPAVWQVHRAMHAEIAIPGGGASLDITAVRRTAGLRVQYAVAAPLANHDAATVVSSTDGTGLASVNAKSEENGGTPSLEYFPVELMKV